MQKNNLPHVSIIQIQAINAYKTNRFQKKQMTFRKMYFLAKQISIKN